MLPGGAELERGDPGRGLGQQLPVVADQQHRLLRRRELLLQPALARHVEVVVRLVEQQHLVRPAQQRLQREPLLLAAGQRADLAPLGPVVRDAERGGAAGVEGDLGLVAAGVGVVGQRLGVAQLDGLGVVAPSAPARPRRRARGGRAEPRRRQREQQVADGASRRGCSR